MKICTVDGCGKPVRARGYCTTHYRRLQKYGDVSILLVNRGSAYVDPVGYAVVSVNGKRTYQHRAVMEAYLGRRLETHEVVHHINGCKSDNRLENLEIVSVKAHNTLHVTGPRPAKYTPTHKWCNRCKQFLVHDAFAKSPRTTHGLSVWCKRCRNAESKKWDYSPGGRRYKG